MTHRSVMPLFERFVASVADAVARPRGDTRLWDAAHEAADMALLTLPSLDRATLRQRCEFSFFIFYFFLVSDSHSQPPFFLHTGCCC